MIDLESEWPAYPTKATRVVKEPQAKWEQWHPSSSQMRAAKAIELDEESEANE